MAPDAGVGGGIPRLTGKPGTSPHDRFWKGALVGFLVPLVVMIVWFLVIYFRASHPLELRSYLLYGGTMGRIVAVATFFNVIPHGVLVHREWWRACRGVIFSTIILAVLSVSLHLLRGTFEQLI